MAQAVASTTGGGVAEMRVRIGGVALAISTDRPSLLPSLLDRLPGGWQQITTIRLARSYILWAEKAPFRLQIDQVVVTEKSDLADVLDAFAADVARFVGAA